jgi:1-deoxy-D-xylulose-5-phosphate synthase
VPLESNPRPLPIGRAETLVEGDDVCLIALGAPVGAALEAAEKLSRQGVSAGVLNARFAKPLDEQALLQAARRYRRLVTIEEHVVAGGFGSAVLELLAKHDYLQHTRVVQIGLDDAFVEHGPQSVLRRDHGLDASGIVRAIAHAYPELSLRKHA